MQIFLVGTDFSPSSDSALATACELAAGCGAQVHLLHVLALADDPDSTDPDTREFYTRLSAAAELKLVAQVERVGTELPVQSQLKIGSRPQTMLEVAQALQASMIVMGSRPLTADCATLSLSVSHRLALTSTVPVLLVPVLETPSS